ncbi:MAG: hypothetical protein IT166_23480 [Bryobacterales bacterium]|nr:hypothetical protein [Bryobacterales bacterium]
MNPSNHHPRDADNIRQMIGGYASGNLSPREKEKLFDAALHDQHLFDALMDEQVLKDFLEQPGVKAGLLDALQPKPSLWSRLTRWFPPAYAAAGALAAAVLIVVVINRSSPRQKAVQMAQSPPSAARTITPSVPSPPLAARREPAPQPRERKNIEASPPIPNAPQSPMPQERLDESRQSKPALGQLSKKEQEPLREEAQQSRPTNAPAPAGPAGVIGGFPASAPPPSPALSLTYTLLRQDPDGRYLPVTTPSVSGTDSLRLEVTPNSDGVLYLYSRNEAGLETPILTGLPLLREQTTTVPPTGGFSAAGAPRLLLVFRREAASDSKDLASRSYRQRMRVAGERDKAPPPDASLALRKAALPAAGPARLSAVSSSAREVSVEITIHAN